jgi:hypothetical protein
LERLKARSSVSRRSSSRCQLAIGFIGNVVDHLVRQSLPEGSGAWSPPPKRRAPPLDTSASGSPPPDELRHPAPFCLAGDF